MHLPIPNHDPNFHMDELSYFTNQHIHERKGDFPTEPFIISDAFPPKKSQRNPPNLRLNQVPEDLLVEQNQLEQHTHALVKLP